MRMKKNIFGIQRICRQALGAGRGCCMIDRIGTKNTAKWGVQLVEMNFQTLPRTEKDRGYE